VVVIRIALIPLFVRPIKSPRNLQILPPKIKEIQAKYAGDRERQSQEMMALYKDTGTNPLASCLPILAQAPIFFALFRVLNEASPPVPLRRHDAGGSCARLDDLRRPLWATFHGRRPQPDGDALHGHLIVS
jgi:YidC/Oxa1 family membrane protein insertase